MEQSHIEITVQNCTNILRPVYDRLDNIDVLLANLEGHLHCISTQLSNIQVEVDGIQKWVSGKVEKQADETRKRVRNQENEKEAEVLTDKVKKERIERANNLAKNRSGQTNSSTNFTSLLVMEVI
jgi:hypothetical protein